MNKFKAQKIISTIWFGFSIIIGLMLILMTMSKKFEPNTIDVWKWYSLFIVPSLSLILTTFLVNLRNTETVTTSTIDKFYVSFTCLTSCCYLLLLTGMVAYLPFNNFSLEVFNSSGLYLGIFNGLVASSMGLFFTK